MAISRVIVAQIYCPVHGFTPTPGCCADPPEPEEAGEKSVWWDFLEEIRKDLEEKTKMTWTIDRFNGIQKNSLEAFPVDKEMYTDENMVEVVTDVMKAATTELIKEQLNWAKELLPSPLEAFPVDKDLFFLVNKIRAISDDPPSPITANRTISTKTIAIIQACSCTKKGLIIEDKKDLYRVYSYCSTANCSFLVSSTELNYDRIFGSKEWVAEQEAQGNTFFMQDLYVSGIPRVRLR